MDTATSKISPKNSSNEQNKKRKKFIYDRNAKKIVEFLLGSSFIGLITFFVGMYLTDKAQKQQIMTDYIKDMSTLMLNEEVYRGNIALDDLNDEVAKKIIEKSILTKNINDSEIPLLNEELKYAEKKHREKKLIARAFTFNTLHRFEKDGNLKGQVIQFLYESDLIGFCKLPDSIADVSKIKCSKNRPIIELIPIH